MAQDWAESTMKLIDYGRFINQVPQDIKIDTATWKDKDKNIFILFNQICIKWRNAAQIRVYTHLTHYQKHPVHAWTKRTLGTPVN